ncbi:MAG: hypothetical protein Q9205_003477 [Flavoplaca limonia]
MVVMADVMEGGGGDRHTVLTIGGTGAEEDGMHTTMTPITVTATMRFIPMEAWMNSTPAPWAVAAAIDIDLATIQVWSLIIDNMLGCVIKEIRGICEVTMGGECMEAIRMLLMIIGMKFQDVASRHE